MRHVPFGGWRAAGLAAALATAASLAVGTWLASPVAAAEPTFGTPTIEGSFGEGIELTQPVTLDAAPARIELLLRYADADAPLVVELPGPSGPGTVTMRHTLDTSSDGHILPNTPVEARWRITPTDGDAVVGPSARLTYADERFDWQTVSGDIVRVHWYEGSRAFGERALAIGEQAVRATTALLGVTEDEPVDFYVYADVEDFYDALGPGTQENVGGQANAEIRTLFALIEPGQIDAPWVASVVPHELVHLVFDTAVSNPYHFPPRWLNEGLAVYLSDGYDASNRAQVASAARRGALIPLDGLAGAFPTTNDGFALAYAESVSAIDFLVRTHDQEALVSLIGSYADGRTDDEAFEAAIGMDVDAFGAAWLADLGVEPPVRHGPVPAPDGPVPSAWSDPNATPLPGAPAVESEPPGGDGATTAPAGPSAPTTPATGDAGRTGLLVAVALITAAGVVALIGVRLRRDRRGGEAGGPGRDAIP